MIEPIGIPVPQGVVKSLCCGGGWNEAVNSPNSHLLSELFRVEPVHVSFATNLGDCVLNMFPY